MKFMNIIKKFKNHQDYVAHRNTMLDEAEVLLGNGDMDAYNTQMEDISTFDTEYRNYTENQANIAAMRNEGQPVNAMVNPLGINTGVVSVENNQSEYRMAFMNYVLKGTEIPAQLKNADASTSTTDASTVIPTTIVNRIVERMERVGDILNKVTRTTFQGGVSVPTSSAKPTATWTTEHGTTDKQKKTLGSISFSYYKLRCVVSVGIITDVVSLEVFESTLSKNIADAMIKALETAIIDGSGTNQPKGVLKETPEATVDIAKANSITYKDLCAAEAKLPSSYEAGSEWYMSKNTFFNQIAAMVDTNGQPVARVTVGLDGKPAYNILGRTVNFTDYVSDYVAAPTADTIVAFIFRMSDYMLNTNMNITVKKYEDEDTDDQLTKAIMIADGKAIDKSSLIEIVKKNA